ncbi:unnamed protein product [Meloidogyne enterolobii]|uniref:Uncharacterized protein n=2 Tax=Meloidogyne enterolobii TaxID=390850 RepID=A0A6V7Y4R3_MELEN|nr:unnamed protein product [Meloidogyne enterolobii]
MFTNQFTTLFQLKFNLMYLLILTLINYFLCNKPFVVLFLRFIDFYLLAELLLLAGFTGFYFFLI